MGVKTGIVPKIHRWGRAERLPDMSRRDFFKVLGKIKEEAIAQADLLSVGAEMETNRQIGRLGLKTNKKVVDIIKKNTKRANKTGAKLYERDLRQEVRDLLKKGHKAVNKEHMAGYEGMAGEAWWEGPRSASDKLWRDTWLPRYKRLLKKTGLTQEGKAEEAINMRHYWADNDKSIIQEGLKAKLLDKAGVTNEVVEKIDELKSLARYGYGKWNFMKGQPLLDKFKEKARVLERITREGSGKSRDYQMGPRYRKKFEATMEKGATGASHTAGLNVKPIVNEVKEVAEEVTKYGENKIKSIWKGLSEEFNKGYHGIEKIPLKKKK